MCYSLPVSIFLRVDPWWPLSVWGTLRHGVGLPQGISNGMQQQMDLMENTFSPFRLLFLPLLLLHPPPWSLSTTNPVPLTSVLGAPFSLLNTCTLPHLPFASFCEMFAFLKSSGHDGFWGNIKGVGGGAFQERSFAYVERDDVLKERRGISVLGGFSIFALQSKRRMRFFGSGFCSAVHERAISFVCVFASDLCVCTTLCWYAETGLLCATC